MLSFGNAARLTLTVCPVLTALLPLRIFPDNRFNRYYRSRPTARGAEKREDDVPARDRTFGR